MFGGFGCGSIGRIGRIGRIGGGDVGGVRLSGWWLQSVDGVLEPEDEVGRDKTVLEGEPVEGVNATGRSVVDGDVANRPSWFLGRLLLLRAARADGLCGY
jgi:hypothetical protein